MKSRNSVITAYAAVMAAFVCFAAVLLQAAAEYPAPPPAEAAQPSMAQLLQTRLGGREPQLTMLYQARNFAPLWFGPAGFSADGRQVLAILAAAGDDALPAQRYGVPQLPDARVPDAAKADFDIALTAAALRYAADMRWGALRPEQLFDDAQMLRDGDDVAGGLSRAATSGTAARYLQSLAPPAREYAQLREALARYRAITAAGGWPVVSAGGQNQLAIRLQQEGYLPSDAASSADVSAALRVFQSDSGLAPSGRLTGETAAMLNVSAAARADAIAANMERLRWMPHYPGAQFILVNVPDASLALMEGGRPALVSKVVVGARNKTTPILATEAVSITINPAWHVPRSIASREIWPKGRGYLAGHHMIVRDGEVVQLPGPGNALGRAKFEMPNSFNVYLHDTPTKKAFLVDDRALSHGCVRVQQILPLAEHVLGLSPEELQRLIDRGRTDGRRLAQPIPVYIQYWTAIPRDDGHVGFREDVYGRDARMIQAMSAGRPPLQLASLGR